MLAGLQYRIQTFFSRMDPRFNSRDVVTLAVTVVNSGGNKYQLVDLVLITTLT